MDLNFSPEEEAFRAEVRAFLADKLPARLSEKVRSGKHLTRDDMAQWHAILNQRGWLANHWPEQYGGPGWNAVQKFIFENECALAHAPRIVPFGVNMLGPVLIKYGSEAQKQRWLPGIASGELIIAIGMTEPSGGSDLAALKTTAVRDGDGWILNGSKTFITNGYQCDLVIVAARTDASRGPKGITLFVVERGMEGFHNGRKLDKVGQDESDTAELFFENVRLPDENRLGPEGLGFIAMMQRLPQERISGAVGNIAHAKAILEETIQYVKERKAFGQAIGSFQYNKFVIAELVTKIEVSEAYVDQCVALHAQKKLSPIDAAKAKWWSSQVQGEVLEACVQLHGGYGFMNEYRVARAWRDARVTKIWAGSNEIMKELIGRDLGL